MGEEHVILPRGDYDYKINYETDGQLGFFDDHDELYWNVNGHAWELDFDSIVCIVHLPKGAPIKTTRHIVVIMVIEKRILKLK